MVDKIIIDYILASPIEFAQRAGRTDINAGVPLSFNGRLARPLEDLADTRAIEGATADTVRLRLSAGNAPVRVHDVVRAVGDSLRRHPCAVTEAEFLAAFWTSYARERVREFGYERSQATFIISLASRMRLDVEVVEEALPMPTITLTPKGADIQINRDSLTADIEAAADRALMAYAFAHRERIADGAWSGEGIHPLASAILSDAISAQIGGRPADYDHLADMIVQSAGQFSTEKLARERSHATGKELFETTRGWFKTGVELQANGFNKTTNWPNEAQAIKASLEAWRLAFNHKMQTGQDIKIAGFRIVRDLKGVAKAEAHTYPATFAGAAAFAANLIEAAKSNPDNQSDEQGEGERDGDESGDSEAQAGQGQGQEGEKEARRSSQGAGAPGADAGAGGKRDQLAKGLERLMSAGDPSEDSAEDGDQKMDAMTQSGQLAGNGLEEVMQLLQLDQEGGGVIESREWIELLNRSLLRHMGFERHSTWMRRSRRFGARDDIYMPGFRRDKANRLAICIDESGSINEGLLKKFGEEMVRALEAIAPQGVDIIHFSDGYRVETLQQGELWEPKRWVNGGTAFLPVYKWLNDAAIEGAKYDAILFFTDLMGESGCLSAANRPLPSTPFIWITYNSGGYKPEFGSWIDMQTGQIRGDELLPED